MNMKAAAAGAPAALLVAILLLFAALSGADASNAACSYGEEAARTGDIDGLTVPVEGTGTGGDGSGTPSTGGAPSKAGDIDGVTGLDEQDAMAWFGGENVCPGQAFGQCVWWACMRTKRLGLPHPQSQWGNGKDVVSRAVAFNGWLATEDPVPGALLSIPAGVYGSSKAYGHVAVVEAVDREAGTVRTSEKGGGYRTYSRTYDVRRALADGVTFANPPGSTDGGTGDGTGAGGGNAGLPGSTPTSVPLEVKDNGDGTRSVNVAASARPAQCSGDGSPFRYRAATAGSADGSAGDVSPDASADGWHATPDTAKSIARGLLPLLIPEARDAGEWQCLADLWTRESDWMWNGDNPSSSAYGIPQALPGSRMASAGDDWRDNAATQIRWGLGYVKERYGTPCKAWAFWQRTDARPIPGHWY